MKNWHSSSQAAESVRARSLWALCWKDAWTNYPWHPLTECWRDLNDGKNSHLHDECPSKLFKMVQKHTQLYMELWNHCLAQVGKFLSGLDSTDETDLTSWHKAGSDTVGYLLNEHATPLLYSHRQEGQERPIADEAGEARSGLYLDCVLLHIRQDEESVHPTKVHVLQSQV